MANGYLPEVVRHACDNPPCCNPLHLLGGTHADNVADKIRRGRGADGSRNGQAKLTEDEVIAIRESRASGESPTDIAVRFGISRKYVWEITAYRSRKAA